MTPPYKAVLTGGLHNWLSNRVFKNYDDIVALCCQAWNNLIEQPWKIMEIGMRDWANEF